jgi:hypothetical protein
MSLTLAIILIIAFCAMLVGGLAFVMSRPANLRPHRPSWRRFAGSRARRRRRHAPETDGSLLP